MVDSDKHNIKSVLTFNVKLKTDFEVWMSNRSVDYIIKEKKSYGAIMIHDHLSYVVKFNFVLEVGQEWIFKGRI